MKRLIPFFVFCLVLSSAQAAQIVRYVDPDAAGAGTGLNWTDAYTSLNAWEAAEQQNLTDAGGDYMTVYCRSSGGTDDTTACIILGWTTGVANYIEIIGSDFPSNGIFDGTKYVLALTNAICIDCRENYVRFIHLQIQATESGTGVPVGFVISTIDAGGSDIRIDSCIIKGVCSGTGSAYGIYCSDGDATVTIYNSIIYGFISGSDTGFLGIQCTASTCNVYNCTIQKCYIGISKISGTVTAKNCAVFNNTYDFVGSIAIDYCASDDGTGTNAENFTAEATDWNAVFTDYTNDDVSLKNYTTSPCCVGQGVDDPGAGLYSDDIIGTARASVWDIGAFEYSAPPAGGAQVIFIELD